MISPALLFGLLHRPNARSERENARQESAGAVRPPSMKGPEQQVFIDFQRRVRPVFKTEGFRVWDLGLREIGQSVRGGRGRM